MAKDEIKNITELFLGKPHKYEFIRADIAFINKVKPLVERDYKLRKYKEQSLGIKHYGSYKEATRHIAEQFQPARVK